MGIVMNIRKIWKTVKDWCWFTFVIRRDEFNRKVVTLADRKRAHECDERWN